LTNNRHFSPGSAPFSSRSQQTERMDCTDAALGPLYRTLDQFALINKLFSPARRLTRQLVIEDMLRRGLHSATIVDVGAGACDYTRWLSAYGSSRGLRLHIIALDTNKQVACYARRACRHIDTIQVVAGSIGCLGEQVDYAVANHVLHHMPPPQVSATLTELDRLCRYGFLITDVHRSWGAYWGYTLFALLFLHRSFARSDGRLSIRRGFRIAEMQQALGSASLGKRAKIFCCAPGHIVLSACTQQEQS
jgi:2-polyprenyl-3-methyl-5-hydroxy-6-metoxy-1,4-benzoquinol methylase